jgi:hypothetical protein
MLNRSRALLLEPLDDQLRAAPEDSEARCSLGVEHFDNLCCSISKKWKRGGDGWLIDEPKGGLVERFLSDKPLCCVSEKRLVARSRYKVVTTIVELMERIKRQSPPLCGLISLFTLVRHL